MNLGILFTTHLAIPGLQVEFLSSEGVMQPERNSKPSSWAHFLEQWSLFSLALTAFLFAMVLSFFLNLTGNPWIHILAGGIFFLIAGGGLILFAMLPAVRSGHFLNFGIKSIPTQRRKHYLWGWGLFLSGLALSAGLMLLRQN